MLKALKKILYEFNVTVFSGSNIVFKTKCEQSKDNKTLQTEVTVVNTSEVPEGTYVFS